MGVIQEFLKESLTYRTTRHIRIDIWQIGLLDKLLTVIVLLIAFVPAIRTGAYALSEVPVGSVNAWTEGTLPTGELQYCNSPSHDFVYYPPRWMYRSPKCLTLTPDDIVVKGTGALSIDTSIIEWTERWWPCDDFSAASNAKRAACSPALKTVDGNQCSCRSPYETFYVKNIEDLTIAFEHSFNTSSTLGYSGSSNKRACTGGVVTDTCAKFPLDTHWVHADRTDTDPAGSTTRIKLKDVLKDLDTTLDDENLASVIDCRDMRSSSSSVCTSSAEAMAGTSSQPDSPRHPFYRMTGLRINVLLQYSNRPGEFGEGTLARAPLHEPDVKTYIKAQRASTGWAGSGPETHILELPSYDARGVKSGVNLKRYRQSVELVFVPAGKLYIFNWIYVGQFVISLFVYFAISKLICDAVAFYLLPGGTSTVLRNKRAEKVSKVSAFAQMGMQAATLVQAFKTLDVGDKGYLEVKDLVSVFGMVEGVDKDQALQVAQTVLRSSYKEGASAAGKIHFDDFMSLMEGDDVLSFQQFVNLVHTTVGKTGRHINRASVEEALDAYDKVENGVDLEEGSAAGGGTSTNSPTPPRHVTCFSCHKTFGAPPGARVVACPHCKTTNTVSLVERQNTFGTFNEAISQFQTFLPFQTSEAQRQASARGPVQVMGGMVPPPASQPMAQPIPVPTAVPMRAQAAVPQVESDFQKAKRAHNETQAAAKAAAKGPPTMSKNVFGKKDDQHI